MELRINMSITCLPSLPLTSLFQYKVVLGDWLDHYQYLEISILGQYKHYCSLTHVTYNFLTPFMDLTFMT